MPTLVRYTRPPMSQVASAPETSQPAVRERVFSGIQPSGASHLGNYLGALLHWVSNHKNELRDAEEATKDARNGFEETYARGFSHGLQRTRSYTKPLVAHPEDSQAEGHIAL